MKKEIYMIKEDKITEKSLKNHFNFLFGVVDKNKQINDLNSEDIKIYYQRFPMKDKQNSVLAIKIKKGSFDNYKNYAFFECQSKYVDDQFNIQFNAYDGKAAIDFISPISEDIVTFFKEVEATLKKENKRDLHVDEEIIYSKMILVNEEPYINKVLKKLFF